MKFGALVITAADRIRDTLTRYSYRLFLNPSTNRVLTVMENEAAAQLARKVRISLWEKYDDKYIIVRFAADWITQQRGVDMLVKILKQGYNSGLVCVSQRDGFEETMDMPARNIPPPPSTYRKHIPPPAVKKDPRQLFINQAFHCLLRKRLYYFVDNGLPLPFLLHASSGPRQQELLLLLPPIYTMVIGATKALKEQVLRTSEDYAVVGPENFRM